jgi:hypothetical protein
MSIRKFRRDEPDNAERLVEREVDAARHGDRRTVELVDSASVEWRTSATAAASQRAPHQLAHVVALEAREFVSWAATVSAKRRSRRARSPCPAAHAGKAPAERATAASTASASASSTVAMIASVAGLSTSMVAIGLLIGCFQTLSE